MDVDQGSNEDGRENSGLGERLVLEGVCRQEEGFGRDGLVVFLILGGLAANGVALAQGEQGFLDGYQQAGDNEGSHGMVEAIDVVKNAYKAFDRQGKGRVNAKVNASGVPRLLAV